MPLYKSALFACGLVLFVLTLVVNALARWIVSLGDIERRADRIRKGEPVEALRT